MKRVTTNLTDRDCLRATVFAETLRCSRSALLCRIIRDALRNSAYCELLSNEVLGDPLPFDGSEARK